MLEPIFNDTVGTSFLKTRNATNVKIKNSVFVGPRVENSHFCFKI